MPKDRITPAQFRSFHNGRIGTVSDYLLPDSAVTTAKNVHFDIIGRVSLRPGITLIGSQIADTYPCLGLYYFKSNTTAYSKLISVFQDGTYNNIYRLSGTWGEINVSLNDTKGLKTRFTSFLDRMIRVNGTDNAKAWDGNAGDWSQYIGTAAKDLNLDDMDSYDCSLIENFKQRVYMAGNSTNPDRLFYSTVVSSTPHITWAPTTDYVDINPNDGDNLTALIKYAYNLLVFKNYFLYRYYGSAGVDPEPVIDIGTSSQETVVKGKDGIYYFCSAPIGIYRYSGAYPSEISRPVADFLEAVPSTYFTTISSWVEADGDHVCFSIGDVTVGGVSWTNVVLRYTISSQVWTVYSYASEIRRGCLYDNGTNVVTAVGDDDGNVLTLNSGLTDNGTAIEYDLITKFYELGAVAETKHIDALAGVCEKAQGGKLSYQIDDKTTWSSIGQLKKYVTIFKNQNIEGHRIRFRLYGSSAVAAFIFEGIEILSAINNGLTE